MLGLVLSLLGALLGPAPFRAPQRGAACVSSCAAGTGEELLAAAAAASSGGSSVGRAAPVPAAVTGAAARNTTHGRLLACALRLQVIDPSSGPGSIGLALQGAPLAAHNVTSLLLMLKRRQRWKQSAMLLEYAQASRVPLRTMHYNLVISACARPSPRRALTLFAKLLAEGPAVPPDVVSYNAAMSAASYAGEQPQVYELLAEMRARGLEPTAISFNIAISACAKVRTGQQIESIPPHLGGCREVVAVEGATCPGAPAPGAENLVGRSRCTLVWAINSISSFFAPLRQGCWRPYVGNTRIHIPNAPSQGP